MDRLAFIVFSVGALLPGVFYIMWTRRTDTKTTSYRDLKCERDALLFMNFLFAFWILGAAPHANWTFLGTPWTSLLYVVCLQLAYFVVRGILPKLDQTTLVKNEPRSA